MLRLVPLDKKKNEEGNVQGTWSPLFFLQLVSFLNIFIKLEENNEVFAETCWFHESASIIAKQRVIISQATKSVIFGPHLENSENYPCLNVIITRRNIFK